MASKAKKAKLSTPVADGTSSGDEDNDLPECPYGARCYRKNPQHFKEFSHPAQDGVTTTTATTTTPSPPSKRKIASTSTLTDSLPPCKYGAHCYRKNLIHFAEFSHPTTTAKGTDSKADRTDSGSDTDVFDSDDDDSKGKNGTSLLAKGESQLVKSYTKMTEEERKELIKKAFEAKKELQEELRKTKQQMAEKDKELKKLQDQVTTGLLLVEGEKEALEGNVTKYFTLHAERAYKEGSADQIHFRLAESQFYRLLSGQYSNSYRVSKVEYVVNPTVVKDFNEAREDLKKEHGEKLSYPVLAFHGTSDSNITKICEGGFLVPGEKGFKHKTDTGWYGKGVYFSEYPEYSMSYIQGSTRLLLCQVLPGKVYNCTKVIHGAKLKPGYDSHMSPCKKELVIFNSHHIVPSYVVHYTSAQAEFKYGTSTVGTDVDLNNKYAKACAAPVKKPGVFNKTAFTFSGAMVAPQKAIQDLVIKHGGKIGTAKKFDYLITTEDTVNLCTSKVQAAQDMGPGTMLSQGYLFDMIIKKGKLDNMDDYQL